MASQGIQINVHQAIKQSSISSKFLRNKVKQCVSILIGPYSFKCFFCCFRSSTDSEDSSVEVDSTSASSDHSSTTASQTSDYMTTRTRGNHTASTQQISSYPFRRRSRANQPSATQRASSIIDLASDATVNQTPSGSDDYAAYLSIMGSISDLSSDDEELNHAIMARKESHM